MIKITSQAIYVFRAKYLSAIDGDTVLAKLDLGWRHVWETNATLLGVDVYERFGVNAHSLGNPARDLLDELMDHHGPYFYLVSDRHAAVSQRRVAGRFFLDTGDAMNFVDVAETMRASGFDKALDNYDGVVRTMTRCGSDIISAAMTDSPLIEM